MTKRHWLTMVLALAGAATVSSNLAGAAPPDKKESAAPRDLVWPGPPEQPRIRFLAEISSGEDVTGKVKLSFFERMAGRAPVRDQRRLRKPYGVAVDRNGRIYVADPAQRTVLVFDRKARAATQLHGSAQFPLFLPIGVSLDGDDRLFVSDSFGTQVVVFDPGGKPVAAFGKGALKRPGGLVVDSRRGRVFVPDVKLNQVLVFDARNYKLLKTIGGTSKTGAYEPGTFSGPTNLAVDSKSNLYVTDTFNCRIQVFDPEGRFLRTFGSQGIQPGNFVRPKGIAIDSEDHVYVVDAEFNNFQIFTPDGKPLLFVGSIGDQPGQFLLPTGMTIDRDDRIYVTEQRVTGGRLQIFQYLPERPGVPPRSN